MRANSRPNRAYTARIYIRPLPAASAKLAGVPARNESFLKRHSLSISSAAIVLLFLLLYVDADPATHSGAFFGNAIADWAGVLVTVIATKHLSERKTHARFPSGSPLSDRMHYFAHNHSLTIFLVLTGFGWVLVYLRLNSESKWGQVAGSLVSEWTQTLGLILMSKRFIERAKDRMASNVH
jgi:hypothetical protein